MATPGTDANIDLDKSTKSLSLFDAHNHIHMSIKQGIPLLLTQSSQKHLQKQHEEDHDSNGGNMEFVVEIKYHVSDIMTSLMPRCTTNNASSDNDEKDENENILDSLGETFVDGMAIMSTQPYDFDIVE